MESDINDSQDSIIFRKPSLNDGLAIYELIKRSPPLDVNSSYLYFLQASHFADTCIVVESQQKIVGFVSAYYRPDQPDSLFVWQVAVDETMRGIGLAKRMLMALVENQKDHPALKELCCTISPSNKASQGLFKSFSKQFGLAFTVTPFITEAHFGEQAHEAEELYVLKSDKQENLTNLIF